jgi:hypothetical protein
MSDVGVGAIDESDGVSPIDAALCGYFDLCSAGGAGCGRGDWG